MESTDWICNASHINSRMVMSLVRRPRLGVVLMVAVGIVMWVASIVYQSPNNDKGFLNSDPLILVSSSKVDKQVNVRHRDLVIIDDDGNKEREDTNNDTMDEDHGGNQTTKFNQQVPVLKNITSKQYDMLNRPTELRKTCEVNNYGPTSQKRYKDSYTEHIIVNKEHRILYCYIPKVANTNFRRVFYALQGMLSLSEAFNISGHDVYFTYDKNLVYLRDMPLQERLTAMNTYQKFLFVRDPFERLLSAFRSKFYHPNERNRWTFYKNFYTFYEKNPMLAKEKNLRTAFNDESPIKFSEFVVYWVDLHNTGSLVNEHFMLYNDMCQPCKIDYDFIGKYENIQEETDFMFKSFNVNVSFPPRNDHFSPIRTSSLVEEAYRNVPNQVLERMCDIFTTDLKLFGYEIPGWLQNRLK